jgi:predicted enzyme involved in methoxymalonyl-ACP biosynthesis
VKKNKSVWTVDSFLLSCRVIGRGVEEVMLAYIFEEARREGASMIIGEFIRTKKNEPAKDFYRKCGFKLVSTNDLTEVWECGIAGGVTYPAYIEVVKAE